MRKIFFLSILIVGLIKNVSAQSIPDYKNPLLPIQLRVNDLLKRMTPEEKFRQLLAIALNEKFDSVAFKNGIYGIELGSEIIDNTATQQLINNNSKDDAIAMTNRINSLQKYFVEQTRLGIPAIFFGEALHGVVAKNATVFPQSIALAASFDTALMHKVANAIACETQQRGIRQVLSPVINIASDVRWGRVEETYGEDVHLTTEMGVAFVSEFEKKNIVTTPKHFIANVGDGGRDSYPIHLDERTLNEQYFPPFKACIQRGGSRSIMSSYNSLNGSPCSMNNWLLNKKLKSEWKFNGVIISDAGAVGGANVLHNTSADYPASGKQSIENGLDIIFQTSIHHDTLFNKYFLKNEVSKAAIDSAVARILRLKFELGLFENPYNISPALSFSKRVTQEIDNENLAKKAAVESMVLLKNKNNILPLTNFPQMPDTAKNNLNNDLSDVPISEEQRYSIGNPIAVIGLDATECRLGGYSGKPVNCVSILDGITKRFGWFNTIYYSNQIGRNENDFSIISNEYLFNSKNENGIDAKYFDNLTCSQPSIFERTEKELNFHYTFYSQGKKVKADYFSVEFYTKLKSPKSGIYKIGLEGNDGYRMYINGNLVIDNWQKISFHRQTVDFNFEKDKSYNIKIQFYESAGNSELKLVWDINKDIYAEDRMKDAIHTAEKSKVIIVCAGINEGEFNDRKFLSLPGRQEEMILQLAKLHKPIIVLLNGGSAITMNKWIDSVDAIIDCWYGGEQQGNAVAALLVGDANPSGKLPITFPMDEGQCPLVYNHEPTGRGDDYTDGSGLPLFPFGFGLSYSTFEFSNLKIDKLILKKNEIATIQFELKNTSKIHGSEVVQLYISQPISKLTQPVLALKQFQKIFLQAGETKIISMKITPEILKHFDNNNQEIIEEGVYKIKIGNSSREIKLMTDVIIK